MPVQAGEGHLETESTVPGVRGKGGLAVMAGSSQVTRTLGFTAILCLFISKQPQINVEANPSGVVRDVYASLGIFQVIITSWESCSEHSTGLQHILVLGDFSKLENVESSCRGTLVILALRQEDCHQSKVRLGYVTRHTVSKTVGKNEGITGATINIFIRTKETRSLKLVFINSL